MAVGGGLIGRPEVVADGDCGRRWPVVVAGCWVVMVHLFNYLIPKIPLASFLKIQFNQLLYISNCNLVHKFEPLDDQINLFKNKIN